jgi:two-component system phosphate regulon sensor histidine kinase PhoR
MKLGYRGKLFGISLIATLIVVAAVGVIIEATLRGWLEQRLSAELLERANLVRVALEQPPLLPVQDHVAPLVNGLGDAAGAHVRFIDTSGDLLGDSWLDPTRIAEHPDASPAELTTLAQQGPRQTIQPDQRGRPTRTLDLVVPISGPHLKGFARLSLPLTEVDRITERVRLMMLIASTFGVFAALAMSWLAAHLMSRTLRSLVEHAHTVGSTSIPTVIPADETDEPTSTELDDQDFSELDGGSVTRLTRDLERAMSALARERDHLRTVLEGMDEGVIALNSRHQITLLNPAAELLLANELEALNGQALGSRVTEILPQPALLDLLEDTKKHDHPLVELSLHGPPPRRVIARASKRQRSPGFIIVLHDVTELRQLETIRRDFVTNVSHELRTPVAVIMANAEALATGALDDPPRARHFIDVLLRNAERLSRLISDLLDMARLESGKLPLNLESIQLAEAVMLVLDNLEDRAQQRSQELDAQIDLDLFVLADAKALDQILYNLVDNAIKYTPDGGHILVRAARIHDELTPYEQHTIRVEVSDSGPGIPAEHRARVFERFYRVDQGRSRDMGGTGLGLAIVKHLSGAMGGRVGVRANEGTGSTFWLRLPQAKPTPQYTQDAV